MQIPGDPAQVLIGPLLAFVAVLLVQGINIFFTIRLHRFQDRSLKNAERDIDAKITGTEIKTFNDYLKQATDYFKSNERQSDLIAIFLLYDLAILQRQRSSIVVKIICELIRIRAPLSYSNLGAHLKLKHSERKVFNSILEAVNTNDDDALWQRKMSIADFASKAQIDEAFLHEAMFAVFKITCDEINATAAGDERHVLRHANINRLRSRRISMIKNLRFSDCIIANLDLEVKEMENVTFSRCIILDSSIVSEKYNQVDLNTCIVFNTFFRAKTGGRIMEPRNGIAHALAEGVIDRNSIWQNA